MEVGTRCPREHEVGKFCSEGAWNRWLCGAQGHGAGRWEGGRAQAHGEGPGPARGGLCEAHRRSPARVRRAPQGAARRATNLPARSAAVRGALGSHPAPSHARSLTLDAGSGGVPGTLTPAFAPPLGTDAASRWPSPAPQGGGAGAQASPRGGEGARVEPAAAARPWGTRSRPPPRVPPAQCSCARPSLYSGRGSRAVRTQTQRGGSDSGAGPPASGAGERVPEPARPCLSFVAPS